jgi:prepilin-type N-terminal cleavage/methylation domain-containing protein
VRRPPEAPADHGFSLPELLVTVVLLAMVSAAVVSSVVAVQRNLGVARGTMLDTAANRIAVERAASLLRGAVAPDGLLDGDAPAVTVAEPDVVRLHSVTGVDPAANPVQVELAVEGGELVERIWDPVPALQADLGPGDVPAYPAAPDRQRVVVRDLAGDQVFRYWTHTVEGAAAQRCGRLLAAPAGAQLRIVDAVSLRLVVREPSGYGSAASELQSWARFASSEVLGSSTAALPADCLDVVGFAYDDPVAP